MSDHREARQLVVFSLASELYALPTTDSIAKIGDRLVVLLNPDTIFPDLDAAAACGVQRERLDQFSGVVIDRRVRRRSRCAAAER